MMASIVIPVAKEGEDLYSRVYSLTYHTKLYQYLMYFINPLLRLMMRLTKQGIAKTLLLTHKIGKGGSIKNAIPYTRRGFHEAHLDAKAGKDAGETRVASWGLAGALTLPAEALGRLEAAYGACLERL